MTIFRAHFDGRVLIPDSPIALPTDCPLEVQVEPVASDKPILATGLAKLAELATSFPEDPQWPADGAAQMDHYLYGTPKRTCSFWMPAI